MAQSPVRPRRPPRRRLPKLSKNHDASLRHLLVGGVSRIAGSFFGEAISASTEGALTGALTRMLGLRKRDEGMTAPLKRKSHRAAGSASGVCDNALEPIADIGTDCPVDRRMRAIRLAVDHVRSRIRGDANRHVQRTFSPKRPPAPLGLMPRPAVTEDVRLR